MSRPAPPRRWAISRVCGLPLACLRAGSRRDRPQTSTERLQNRVPGRLVSREGPDQNGQCTGDHHKASARHAAHSANSELQRPRFGIHAERMEQPRNKKCPHQDMNPRCCQPRCFKKGGHERNYRHVFAEMRMGTDCAPKGGIPAVSKGNSISSAQTNDLETEHRIEQRQNGDICSSDRRGFHVVSPVKTAQRTATPIQQRFSDVLKSSRPAADSKRGTPDGTSRRGAIQDRCIAAHRICRVIPANFSTRIMSARVTTTITPEAAAVRTSRFVSICCQR